MSNFTSQFKRIIRRFDLILLTILILVYAVTFSNLSILRHNAFASNFDLANMNQTVWNTLHGRIFALSGAEGTISRFTIHADLILVLLSPFYLIWERAVTLLVIQSVALALGAVPVYFLSKKILNSKFSALCLSAVYLLNPSLQWTNIYDFHGVALAIPFLLSAFYFAYTKKWRWYWLFILLSLSTKEEISLLVATLGLAIIFIFKEKLIGLISLLIGIGWFILMVFFIMPYESAGGEHWAFNNLYMPAIQKFFDARSIPQFLDILRGYFLISSSLNYYLMLLKPFSFLPIIGFPWLILAAPEFAINLMSTNFQMHTITFHYDSGITPFLVISTIFGMKYLLKFISYVKPLSKYSKQLLFMLSLGMLIIGLRVNYHYSPLPTTPSCWCLSYRVTKEDKEFAKILMSIPKNASVTSSGEIRPHIARRENSFTLPGHVDTADYVAILDENRIVGDYSPKEFENILLKEPVFLRTHDLVSHIGHFYLFKKK